MTTRGHVPQRSCIACRQAATKGELLRIVRTLTGEIKADPTGKVPGRGAYLCRKEKCVQIAIKEKKLERALGKRPGDNLLAEIAALIKQAGPE
jgi:uncharacterized protein